MNAHHFLSGPQDTHLPEADVEWGALQGAIGLADHDDVDTSRQRRRVQAPVKLLDLHEHLTRQLTHIVHGLYLETDRGDNVGSRSYSKSSTICSLVQRCCFFFLC